MGSFRKSLILVYLFSSLGFAQDEMDDGFSLPDLPPPAKEQPAAVASSSSAAIHALSTARAVAPLFSALSSSSQVQKATAPSSSSVGKIKYEIQKQVVASSSSVKPVEPATRPAEQPAQSAQPTQSAQPVTPPAQNQKATASKGEDSAILVQSHKIPDRLDRPVRVGVFINEKNLFIKAHGEEIKITAEGNQLQIKSPSHSETVENREFYGEDKCLNIATQQKQLSSSCFPGYFIVKASKGLVTAINIVEVEDYVKGVIPYEIGKLDSNRFDALKAQAVAARTYVYKHFDSRDALGFDVYADTKDQVYKGYQNATPLTDAAVEQTAGEVMTYNNGEFIIAYYHSTCGGQTESLQTWEKKGLPYLQSKPDLRPNGKPWCDESSYNSWERTFSDKDVATLFKQNAKEAKAKVPDFKKVKDIAVRKKLPSGRILILQVLTDKGVFDVVGDKVRWLFKTKGTILPSSFFSIYHEGHSWVLKGKGFGHGVGMCQMGVRARAQAGQNYRDILTHYYPDITLERFER